MVVSISDVRGLEVLDSRGRPTVEAQIRLDNGQVAVASVPSGASTGRHEAHELRDGDLTRYGGLGVRRVVRMIDTEIADLLVGREPLGGEVDELLVELDGTADKSRLGANGMLAVSMAAAKAEAALHRVPLWRQFERGRQATLPMPMVNIISGGLHAGRQLDFQDFLVIPIGALSYSQALEMVVAVHRATGEVLAGRGESTLKADEGGYGPTLPTHRAALEILQEAAGNAGLRPGVDVAYALDIAASHFFDESRNEYVLASEGETLAASEFGDYIAELIATYPIVSVEDAFAEDDWQAWSGFTVRFGDQIQIVGDDLFTTNASRVQRGIDERCANSVLVKMNQIGTVSEAIDVAAQAHGAGFSTVVSARSGETEDTALADFAVGLGAGQIKIGSVTQSERLAKYNRLLRIEDELGSDAKFATWRISHISPTW